MNTEEILNKYKDSSRESLIPILQEIQESEGWLSEDSIKAVGDQLKLQVSKVFGVATFYNQFRFKPKGEFHIQVCRGTACHVLGSSTVLEEIKKAIRINVDETTRDGMFSLEVVSCIGTCGLAPVININGNFHAGVTSGKIEEIIESYRKVSKDKRK